MNNRKDEHLDLALANYQVRNNFDDIYLMPSAISTVNSRTVDLGCNFLTSKQSLPLYINAITGGSDRADQLNSELLEVAAATGLPIALGSCSPLLNNPNLIIKYKEMRQNYKHIYLGINIGADRDFAKVEPVLEALQPQFLQVHINPIQELIMPEGEKDFSSQLANLKSFLDNSPVPVVIKAVGFGMTEKDYRQLMKLGAKYIDISGRGGTNFAKIENDRRHMPLPYLNEWGLTTLEAMLLSKPYQLHMNFLASGGIYNPLDVIKCIILGAKAVGISGLILNALTNDGVAGAVHLLERWEQELKLLLTALNCNKLADLAQVEYILKGDAYLFNLQTQKKRSL